MAYYQVPMTVRRVVDRLSPQSLRRIVNHWGHGMARKHKEAFKVSGHHQHGGAKWPDSWAAIQRRIRLIPNRPVLVDTGKMMRSVHWNSSELILSVWRFSPGEGDVISKLRSINPLWIVLHVTRQDLAELQTAVQMHLHGKGMDTLGRPLRGRRKK